MEQPRRPVVTVHDTQGGGPVDVLDSEPAGPPLLTRRRAVVAAALFSVVALVAGALELRERRSGAAELRRLDAAVELSLSSEARSGSTSGPGQSSLDVELGVRNDGPRAVEVTGAAWAGFALLRPVEVPAGGERQIALVQEVECGAGRPALLAVGDDVELQVRTPSTTRTVALPLPSEPVRPTDAERVCGFVPLAEALLVSLERQERVGEEAVLRLDLSVDGGSPVELLFLDAGPGLAARLRTGGGAEAVPLPTLLRPASGAFVATTYEAVLTVVDCAAAAATNSFAGLTLGTSDRQGGTTELGLGYEPSLLGDLVSASCPG